VPLDPCYLFPIWPLTNQGPARRKQIGASPAGGKTWAIRSIKLHLTLVTCCLS